MRQWLRQHRKLAIFIGVLAALWLGNLVFLGFSFDFFAKQRLEAAQASWESQNIHDYRMIIEYAGGFTLRTQYSVTVRDNQVVDAAERLMMSLIDRDYDPSDVPFSSIPVEDADDLTIDKLFEYMNARLGNDTFIHVNNACNHYEVNFDPKMSYINLYANRCVSSLLGCVSGECEYSYRVIELEPLLPDTE